MSYLKCDRNEARLTSNITRETALMNPTDEKEEIESDHTELTDISKIIDLARFSTLGKLLPVIFAV